MIETLGSTTDLQSIRSDLERVEYLLSHRNFRDPRVDPILLNVRMSLINLHVILHNGLLELVMGNTGNGNDVPDTNTQDDSIEPGVF